MKKRTLDDQLKIYAVILFLLGFGVNFLGEAKYLMLELLAAELIGAAMGLLAAAIFFRRHVIESVSQNRIEVN